MNDKPTSNEAETGGAKTKSRQGQYAKFEPLVDSSITRLKLLLESRNEAIALGAIKTVLERTIPAIKALEITGEDGQPIKHNIIAGADYLSYLSRLQQAQTASGEGAYAGVVTLSSADMAQTSTENNNSNNTVSTVDST
jgi:hypothetical protein